LPPGADFADLFPATTGNPPAPGGCSLIALGFLNHVVCTCSVFFGLSVNIFFQALIGNRGATIQPPCARRRSKRNLARLVMRWLLALLCHKILEFPTLGETTDLTD